MVMLVTMELGMKVKLKRVSRKLTQRELAELVGDCSHAFISKVENGLCDPRVGDLERIAKALGLTMSELCDEGAA